MEVTMHSVVLAASDLDRSIERYGRIFRLKQVAAFRSNKANRSQVLVLREDRHATHPGTGTGVEVASPAEPAEVEERFAEGTPMSDGSREICLRRFSAMTRTTMPFQFPPAWRIARLRHRNDWIPTRSSENSAQ
jgi:catechol 2,3-dioxygenase-like lactoylglutathione lyase family enzyme